MFKLLIVDDESYTREGIIEMMPWDELDITEIRQAFDGVNALEIMNEYKPDIILSDIKMPRMNGIDLAINIRKSSSTCAIIFMSSYSDKMYFKSAIQLKAVNYIEKPLDLQELYSTIKNSNLEMSKLKVLKENIENKIASELAKQTNINKIDELLTNCYSINFINKLKSCSIVTVFIKLFNELNDTNKMIIDSIKNIIKTHNYECILSIKNDNLLVIHLFKKNIYLNYKDSNNINLLLLIISEYIDNFTKHYICVGSIVNRLEDINISYTDCKKLLNNIFYYDYNSIIFTIKKTESDSNKTNIIYKDFEDILRKGDKNIIFSYTQKLHKEFKVPGAYSPSFIKDVYYNLTIRILNFSKSKNINLDTSYQSDNFLNNILNFNNIYELNNYLWIKIDNLFTSINNENYLYEPVQKVVEFINSNYSDPNFSLDEISKNTFLTSSYICVIFKDFMGTTVNKYINELRINKAKELLKNHEIKMKDIASKIGYSDANYFAKIFKKETGSNPSDYRRNFSK